MEDFLILLLQALGELIFELFAWGPWDWIWYWGETKWDSPRRPNPYWIAGPSSLVVGTLLGWGSIYLFPAVLVKWSWLRIALLFLAPLASGFMAREIARWRQERKASIDLTLHFLVGLCFSVGFVGVRFALAHRTG